MGVTGEKTDEVVGDEAELEEEEILDCKRSAICAFSAASSLSK